MNIINKEYLWGVHKKRNIKFSFGKGCFLFRTKMFIKKEKYLDFNAGGGAISLGYSNKKLLSALNRQSKKIWHVSNYYKNSIAEKLAKVLCLSSGFEKAFFLNSGSEGVEFALKVARRFYFNTDKEKNHIISIKGGYHGRTMGALSTSSNHFHREGFGPLLEGFTQVEPIIEDIKKSITEKTAAIIIEPILSHKDMTFLGWRFFKELRLICDQKNLLLILDEVQTGFGRTGKMFAFQYANIKPDLLILSKGIAGGFPFSGVLANEKIASSLPISAHGGTFGGNPLGCAVAFECIKQISNPDFLDNVIKNSKYLDDALNDLYDKFHDIIQGVAGFGLMRGIIIKNAEHIDKIIDIAVTQNHLLLVKTNDKTIRITPPLIITHNELMLGISKLNKSFKAFMNNF
jgi:acetylornithine/N-succinyldiaminopimelate aminotransferase